MNSSVINYDNYIMTWQGIYSVKNMIYAEESYFLLKKICISIKCEVNNIKFVVVYNVYIKFIFHIQTQNNTLGYITFHSQSIHKAIHLSKNFNINKIIN